ncbi:hypothetical protein K2Q16_02585 [Patescibacteria group bacterium]|nr:hypothetical protein [Patescibacteria group bacterium]
MKDIVIIYHDQCKDGFGAAFAAWKKFGDTATYIPQKTQAPLPDGITEKELYVVDYSFDLPTLTRLRSVNKSMVVIDHHATAQSAVTAFSENVFDLDHSGAVLAWRYFHPNTPVPRLLTYVEDHDLWKFVLPYNREINAAVALEPVSFERWDQLATLLEDDQEFRQCVTTGTTAAKVSDALVLELLTYRERVLFEGHEVYAVNIARPHRSIVGHHLAKLNAAEGRIPLGIVYYHYGGAVHLSLRSEGDIDVGAIAEKYNAGGHKHAASIRVATFNDLPFTFL